MNNKIAYATVSLYILLLSLTPLLGGAYSLKRVGWI